jgi:hypothetical protein
MKIKTNVFSECSGIMSDRSPPFSYEEFMRTKQPIKTKII